MHARHEALAFHDTDRPEEVISIFYESYSLAEGFYAPRSSRVWRPVISNIRLRGMKSPDDPDCCISSGGHLANEKFLVNARRFAWKCKA